MGKPRLVPTLPLQPLSLDSFWTLLVPSPLLSVKVVTQVRFFLYYRITKINQDITVHLNLIPLADVIGC